MTINANEFQDEFYKSLEQGVWTERMGRLMIILVDNIAYSGVVVADKSILDVLKSDVRLYLMEGLWSYKQKDKSSRALYYAASIVRNRFMRLAKTRLGSSATKTIYGTDDYINEYSEEAGRVRRKKVKLVDIRQIENLSDDYSQYI